MTHTELKARNFEILVELEKLQRELQANNSELVRPEVATESQAEPVAEVKEETPAEEVKTEETPAV